MILLLNESVHHAFSFSARDLAANKAGFLSPMQKDSLACSVKGRGCGIKAAYFVMAFSVVTLLVFFLLSADPGSPGFREAMPYLIGTSGVFLLIFAFFLILDAIRSRDLRSGKISSAEGEIHTWQKEYRHGTGYFAEVGGTKFRLKSPEQMEELGSSSFCRIHYISNPPVHIILSFEVTG